MIKRRQFIAGLGSAAVWPFTASSQILGRIRRLGILSGSAENDPNNRTWFSAFEVELQSLGWKEGQNILIERRYAPGDVARMRLPRSSVGAMSLPWPKRRRSKQQPVF